MGRMIVNLWNQVATYSFKINRQQTDYTNMYEYHPMLSVEIAPDGSLHSDWGP
jgi:hypothetical protein